jgi:hypothetical protein
MLLAAFGRIGMKDRAEEIAPDGGTDRWRLIDAEGFRQIPLTAPKVANGLSGSG